MNRPSLSTALALALVTGLASNAGAQSGPGDDLVSGQLSQAGTSVEWGTARGVVDEPIEEVMGVIEDYANYAAFLPHFAASRVLSQRGSAAMVYVEVNVMRNSATLWAQLRIRPRANRGDTRVIEATMTDGNVDLFHALWEVTPVDAGHTMVEFRILVDPDLPLPASVFTGENVKAARRTIRALRRRVAVVA
ncbi:MAG: SRPBCC family protein [Sandaracinaceae bacterium]|nr:SRPBCC family protein [Sandaracinaceae bacterium]